MPQAERRGISQPKRTGGLPLRGVAEWSFEVVASNLP